MLLKDKVAIVTGARQGIGQGIALALAKEGCNVVVSDINQEDCDHVAEDLKKEGVQSIGVQCDVSNRSEIDALIAKTMQTFGKLDILVNNAGIYPFVPFENMTDNDWDKVMNVNVKSVFMASQAAVKEMKAGGKIVNISSIAASVGFEGLVHYCASKGAINAMIRAMSLELAPKKINVNAVAPGAIKTPGASGAMSEEATQQMLAAIPAHRQGTPEDIANAVVFLASDRADYITGQTVIVDGGWTLK